MTRQDASYTLIFADWLLAAGLRSREEIIEASDYLRSLDKQLPVKEAA